MAAEWRPGDKMIKGSKRQIIFLQDLKKTGNGVFESAYFILNSNGTSDITESVMLLEAERIVAEAQKFTRRYERSCFIDSENDCGGMLPKGNAAHKKDACVTDPKKHRARHLLTAFVLGALFGAVVFVSAYFIWRAAAA